MSGELATMVMIVVLLVVVTTVMVMMVMLMLIGDTLFLSFAWLWLPAGCPFLPIWSLSCSLYF